MLTQYAVKQTKEFSDELKSVCFGNDSIMLKLRAAMSVFQKNVEGTTIKAGDICLYVDPSDEFAHIVKKYAYWHN